MTEKSPLERFLELNCESLQAISEIQLDFFYEMRVNRKSNFDFHKRNGTLMEKVNSMVDLYAGQNPGDNIELLRRKFSEISRKTSLWSETLDFAVKFGYRYFDPEPQHPFTQEYVTRLNEIYSKSKKEVNRVGEIETAEEMIRYMHANITNSLLRDAKVSQDSRDGPKVQVMLPHGWHEIPLTFIDLKGGTVQVIGNELISFDPTLTPLLDYLKSIKRTDINGEVIINDGETVIRCRLGQHFSEIQIKRLDRERYHLRYWGTGDPAYGRRRQEFTSKMLEKFGFTTVECGTYGVRMEMDLEGDLTLDLPLKAIFYFMDFSRDMDISGAGCPPESYAKRIKNLVALKKYRQALIEGTFDIGSVFGLDEYIAREARIGNITDRQKRILAIMHVSPFPSLPGGLEVAKDYGGRLTWRNPDAVGFAYYHFDEFFNDRVTRQDVVDFIVDIDLVHSRGFQFRGFDYQEDNPLKYFDPFDSAALENLRSYLKFGFDMVVERKRRMEVGQAIDVMLTADFGFYPVQRSRLPPWEEKLQAH